MSEYFFLFINRTLQCGFVLSEALSGRGRFESIPTVGGYGTVTISLRVRAPASGVRVLRDLRRKGLGDIAERILGGRILRRLLEDVVEPRDQFDSLIGERIEGWRLETIEIDRIILKSGTASATYRIDADPR